MKNILAILLLFSTCCAHAQLSVSVNGGITSNTLHQPTGGLLDKSAYGGNAGWQGSLHAQYSFKHWFAYAGAGLCQSRFYVNATSMYFVYYKDTYKPLYITVPVGAGYRLNFDKNIALRLYAGIYEHYGIGGNVDYKSYSPDTGFPLPVNPQSRKIIFGDTKAGNDPKDLARTNTGLQFGAGLRFWRRVELSALYNASLGNVLSPRAAFSLKLNTLAVNLGYCLYGK